MNCEPMMELIQRDLDHDLTADEKLALQAHLAECPECAGLNERLIMLSLGLEQLPKVKPAFSIVDSILPKLDSLEIEPLAAPAVIDELAARRVKKYGFSWKMASGAAAAVLLIGAVIFQAGNGGFSSKQEVADSNPANRQIIAATEAAQGDRASATKEVLPESDISVKAMDVQDQWGSSVDSAENSGTDHTEPRVLENQELTGTVTLKDSTKKAVEPSSGGGSGQGFAGGSGTVASGSEEMGIASAGEAARGEQPGFDATITGSTDSEPSLKGIGPAPAPVYGIAARIQPVVSADGAYTAQLGDLNAVQILDRNGTVVFTSETVMQPGDTLLFDGWGEGSLFNYRIRSSEGIEASYRIDAAAGTEMKF